MSVRVPGCQKLEMTAYSYAHATVGVKSVKPMKRHAYESFLGKKLSDVS